MTNNSITKDHIAKAFTYPQYKELIHTLLVENKTTGPNQAPDIIDYTRKNHQLMLKIEQKVELDEALIQMLLESKTKMIWLVITEAWCGDAAENLPWFVQMADASLGIELKLLLRDENIDVIDAYLTNGGRSIPKLVALDADTLEEIGTWGPRPVPAQQLYDELKQQQVPFQEFVERIHGWYEEDGGQTLQSEFKELLPQWTNVGQEQKR